MLQTYIFLFSAIKRLPATSDKSKLSSSQNTDHIIPTLCLHYSASPTACDLSRKKNYAIFIFVSPALITEPCLVGSNEMSLEKTK